LFNKQKQDRYWTLNNGVRDAIRRGAAENEVNYIKRKLHVLGDKYVHSGDDMKDDVNVMT